MTSKIAMRNRIEKLEEIVQKQSLDISILKSLLGIEILQRIGARVTIVALRDVQKRSNDQYTKLVIEGELS